tara:strand:- start:79 stop:465 length:387 start_codon:yes stop_codon:yes gene_type:complete
MGYQIEIAFNMRIVGSVTNIYDCFVEKAQKNNCEMQYITYEREGYRGMVTRNHAIMTFIFPDDKKYIINFIRFIREFKEAQIESVATDDIKPIILFASTMESQHVKNYKKPQLSQDHKSIISETNKLH